MQKKVTTESQEESGKERKKMPKGTPITEEDVALMLQLRERGKTNKELANIFGLSESGITNKIGADKPQKENNNTVDLSAIERKIDNLPDVLVRKISEILDFAPNINEHILSLESLGYKCEDKKTYKKKDGNQTRQVSFFNKDQITYSTRDLNGREIERYYFNAETLEAIFGAIVDRGWNYFRK